MSRRLKIAHTEDDHSLTMSDREREAVNTEWEYLKSAHEQKRSELQKLSELCIKYRRNLDEAERRRERYAEYVQSDVEIYHAVANIIAGKIFPEATRKGGKK